MPANSLDVNSWYPSGPRPLPLIRNLIDIPGGFSWPTYTQLSKKHSMIYFAVRWHLTEGMAALMEDLISTYSWAVE